MTNTTKQRRPAGGTDSFRFAAFAAAIIFTAVALLACGCGVPGPERPEGTYGLDFSLPEDAERTGALVFFVDGLNAEIFERMLADGELPAIKKYFVDRGLYFPRAVANVPSVTLANETSFVTGLFPGHHGVTGINWFDRNRLIWRNYETIAQKNTLDCDYTAGTIYERLEGRTTFSIFYQAHRGATKFVENWTSAGPPYFFGWYEFVDRLTLLRLNIVADVARQRGEFPAVTICYMLAPDFRAYGEGVKSEPYRLAVKHTDRQIGRVLADVEKAGLLDDIYILLTSDHGMIEVTKHFDLEKYLAEKLGLHVAKKHLWEEVPFEKRLAYYKDFNTVVYGSGERYWAVCLRKPSRGGRASPWPVRPSAEDMRRYPVSSKGAEVDLIDNIVGLEAVDAVSYSLGGERVRVATKGGEVEFAQPGGRGGEISYKVISGRDPLGWEGTVANELLNGEPALSRTWLGETVDTDYPDLPAQIVAYFRAQRAGDIVVFAAPGWDFGNKHSAGHGGLRPGEMFFPLLIAGKGIKPGRGEAARAVDVVPTLLWLLGRDVPKNLDGDVLPQFRPARSRPAPRER